MRVEGWVIGERADGKEHRRLWQSWLFQFRLFELHLENLTQLASGLLQKV
jgi:hypothetical protein